MSCDSYILSKVPLQNNIKYVVKDVGVGGLAVLTKPIADNVLGMGVEYTKTLIYCQSYTDLLNVYQDLVLCVGGKLTVAISVASEFDSHSNCHATVTFAALQQSLRQTASTNTTPVLRW